MAGLFDVGGLLGPVAPGMSGMVNPLSMLGFGLASGNPLAAMQQMAQMRQAAMQLAQQQEYRQALMEQKRRELEAEQIAAQHAQAQQLAQQNALQALMKVRGYGPEAIEAARQFPEKTYQKMLEAPPERVMKEDVAGRLRYVDTGEPVFPGVQAPAALPKFTEQQALRKEYQALSEDWVTIRDRFEQIQDAPETGAGDTARIIGLMKMYDPTSVVMPGEAATAANAAGVPESLRAMWNQFLGKGRLGEEARRQIDEAAETVMRQQAGRQLARERDFGALAEGRGWRREDVVRDLFGKRIRKRLETPMESLYGQSEPVVTPLPSLAPLPQPAPMRPRPGQVSPRLPWIRERGSNVELGPAPVEAQPYLDKYLR